MKKPHLYNILIPSIVVSAVLIFISWYSIGVIEKNSAKEIADTRINQIISKLDKTTVEFNDLKQQIADEYESKAKTFSVILYQTPRALSEDMAIEELRLAIGADVISVTDEYGNITFSTADDENNNINNEFEDGLDKKSYAKTIIELDDNGTYIFKSAVSRRDSDGLILFTFIDSSLNDILSYSSIASVTTNYPLLQSGITAIVDINSTNFISHTTQALVNTQCPVPVERFDKETGNISYRIYGHSSLIRYRVYNDKVILGILPKTEVFKLRNTTTKWLILACIIINVSVLLSIRQYTIIRKEN
ncbi:MAG: hypothetical protein Q4F95_04270 [Oscillospiraceae bacterium]|nr:hypothetical protein [Oscillospiraceae bacterium]